MLCRAWAAGAVDRYPPRAARPPAVRVRRAVAVVRRRGRLLMVRRTGTQLSGLWEPPGVDLPEHGAARPALAALLRPLRVRAVARPLGLTLRHGITHRRIVAELWEAEPPPRPPAGLRFVDPARPSVALTGLARKAILALTARGSRRPLPRRGSR
jgi:hypothetical protein